MSLRVIAPSGLSLGGLESLAIGGQEDVAMAWQVELVCVFVYSFQDLVEVDLLLHLFFDF